MEMVCERCGHRQGESYEQRVKRLNRERQARYRERHGVEGPAVIANPVVPPGVAVLASRGQGKVAIKNVETTGVSMCPLCECPIGEKWPRCKVPSCACHRAKVGGPRDAR